ncbi:MAG: DUF429 domain-containing protein [Bdellovibrio sp.]|nr:MAG: DUF429 domain-containing protein [Bdellovibrio sp.]
MSEKRVSSVKRAVRRPSFLRKKQFIGLSLAGGKTNKTCFAVLEYFPVKKKIFLVHLETRIQSEGKVSADQKLIESLKPYQKKSSLMAVNAPLTWPKCIRCRLKCPGYEKCKEPEILWMWKQYKKIDKKEKLKKVFTPYAERCAEMYLAHSLEEPFYVSQALGANMAPLAARMFFLKKRFPAKKLIEVHPKVSLWRIGRSLGIRPTHLKKHKHAIGGEEARHIILETLVEKDIAFIYVQDFQTMVQDSGAFDAFISALTALLKHLGHCEPIPKNFPSSEGWIEIPKTDISWPFLVP